MSEITAPARRWRLREWRRHRGYTQERLAEMVGTSKGYLSDLERGNRRYNEEILNALADALRCEPFELLSVDPESEFRSIWEALPKLSDADMKDIADRIRRKVALQARKDGGGRTGTEG